MRHCYRIHSSLTAALVSVMVIWESSQGLGKIILQCTCKRNLMKAQIVLLGVTMCLK